MEVRWASSQFFCYFLLTINLVVVRIFYANVNFASSTILKHYIACK